MAGVKGMHKKTQVTKDETLSVASRSNGVESETNRANRETRTAFTESEQEEKLLKDLMEDYSYWRKQSGEFAKTCAAAYRTLLNEFTAEETKE